MDASGQDSKGFAASREYARRAASRSIELGRTGGSRFASGLARALRAPRAIEVLTIAALVGAVLLAVSSVMDVFTVSDLAGNEIASASHSGFDNHGPALLLIGIAVIVAIFLARSTDQWPPAAGAAGLGLVALTIVLFVDLPDANDSDLLSNGRLGQASAGTGLWLELLAALVVTGSCAGIAWILRERARS